jgi:streptogrisin C
MPGWLTCVVPWPANTPEHPIWRWRAPTFSSVPLATSLQGGQFAVPTPMKGSQRMPRKVAVVTAVTLLTGAMVAVSSYQAIASAATTPAAQPQPAPVVSAEMFAALQREQAKARLATDAKASGIEQKLRGGLGARFGGTWIAPGSSEIVVAVTDASKAAEVRAAGATPKVVARSESQLAGAKSTLDSKAATAPAAVSGWYVDVATNSVVVQASAGGVDAAKSFVTTSGVAADSVRVVVSEEKPRTLADIAGGDAYYINNSARCSVGFPVVGGFVSAGHCGRPGARTTGANGAAQGTFQASTFPGHDYSWVRVNSGWTPQGLVNQYNGSAAVVSGSQEAPVGGSICRSGSTTGWHCGTLQAKNSTVQYAQGSVSGLTRTDVCAEPGDSGGSFMWFNQAQGVTSGGSGDCKSGGTTFFQPVNPILQAYGLRLVTR